MYRYFIGLSLEKIGREEKVHSIPPQRHHPENFIVYMHTHMHTHKREGSGLTQINGE